MTRALQALARGSALAMKWGRRNRGRALLGLTLALSVVTPASASATTGSIEGATIEPSLAHASVQNLSVTYDGCSTAGNPTCSWNAHAWLVAPPKTACPPNGSSFLLALEHPLEMPPPPPSEQPWLGTREVWRLESTGDGSLQSGPLQLNLEGVNHQYLCLYATEPPATSTSTASGGPQPAYIPAFPDSSELLASQPLHVDLPTGEGNQHAIPTVPRAACKKGTVKTHGRCVKKKVKHRRLTCGPATGKTLVAGRQARIYSLPGPEPPETEHIIGCLVATGQSQILNSAVRAKTAPVRGRRPSVETEAISLHAPWVAYAESFHGIDTGQLLVTALNLRSGAAAYCPVGGWQAPHRRVSVTGVALKRNGSVAWIGAGSAHEPDGREAEPISGSLVYGPLEPEIVACDTTGEHVLDSGEGIDLNSLALRSSILTWTNAGATRSAWLR
jgi:hypothetical protein